MLLWGVRRSRLEKCVVFRAPDDGAQGTNDRKVASQRLIPESDAESIVEAPNLSMVELHSDGVGMVIP